MPGETLHDVELAAGAVLAADVARGKAPADAGPAPLHFGDAAAEYAAALSDAALFDVSRRSQIELTGEDRVKFLHGFCTNNVQGLRPGTGCEAFITNVKGRIVGHVHLFAEEDSLWLESVPDAEASLMPHLDRYIINEDVQLVARSVDWGELLICGPRAGERLRTLGADVGDLRLYEHRRVELAGATVSVRRVELTDPPGYLLSAPRGSLAALWRTLHEGGFVPAGSLALEALRIEAGVPWHGVDITSDHLAQEAARTARAVSFTKGCYLGQEPIARLDALGHVNRELRGLRLERGPVPEAGSAVLSPDDGGEIGRVTSSALSYADGRPVALACLRRQFTQPDARVLVARGSDDSVPAVVYLPKAAVTADR